MFKYNRYKSLNESLNLKLALDALDENQFEEFKSWLINNIDSTDLLKIDKIKSLMNAEQISNYNNINNITINDYIANKDEEIESTLKKELEKKINEIVKDLISYMEESRDTWEYAELLVYSLLKRKHRGEELDLNKLSNSTYISKLIRMSLANYNNMEEHKIYITSEIRQVAKIKFAQNILDWVDDWDY